MMKALRKKAGSSTGVGGWSADSSGEKSSSYIDDAEFSELQEQTLARNRVSNGIGGGVGAIDHMNIPDSKPKPSAPTELHQLILAHDWDEMRSMLGFVDDAMSNPSSQGENDVPNSTSNSNNIKVAKGLKKKGLKPRRGGAPSGGEGSTVKRQHCLARDESGRTP